MGLIDKDVPFHPDFGARHGLVADGPEGSVYVVGMTDAAAGQTLFFGGQLRIQRRTWSGDVVFDQLIPEFSFIPLAAKSDSSGNVLVSCFFSDNNNTSIDSANLFTVGRDGAVVKENELPRGINSFSSISLAPDGKITLGGQGNIAPPDSLNFLLWVPEDGQPQSQVFQYNLGGIDRGEALAIAPNGDFILAGTTDVQGVVIRVDPSGNLVWARMDFLDQNAAGQGDEVWDVTVTPDGFIAVVGQETTFDNLFGTFPVVNRRSFIALLDGDGNLVWKTGLGKSTISGITYTQAGTFMTCGNYGDSLNLIEIDRNGKVIN